MNRLHIGLLIPYSGIFKTLRRDFRQGIQLAFDQQLPDYRIDLTEEFIQTGGHAFVEQALNKLVLFEQVDLVMGVIGTRVIMKCLEQINKSRTPVMTSNLGGFVPTYQFRSPFLFHNSLELWKSEWAMGRWAQREYGADPGVSLSYYEAGYNMHECYRYGLHAAGASTVKLNFINKMTTEADTLPLINQLEIMKPGHTHAMLSGKEATQFLHFYNEKKLSSQTALTVQPFMVDECLESEDQNASGLKSAITWTYHLDSKANHDFKSAYEQAYEMRPNVYAMLAYEAGLALAEAVKIHDGKRLSRESLVSELEKCSAKGPRGTFQVRTTPYTSNHPVYIREAAVNNRSGMLENQVIYQEEGLNWEHPDMLEAAYQNVSGWQNPYLCV